MLLSCRGHSETNRQLYHLLLGFHIDIRNSIRISTLSIIHADKTEHGTLRWA